MGSIGSYATNRGDAKSALAQGRAAKEAAYVNAANTDSALFSEPFAVLSVFLEPFLDVTFLVHSLEILYRKRENKRRSFCLFPKKAAH